MVIFKRIRDIISARINDLLERAEDPERALDQMIREIEESIMILRRETASAMASRKMLANKVQTARGEGEKWEENAELALGQDREDLARRAVERKQQAEQLVREFETQVDEAERLVDRLRDRLHRVEDKVQEARAKRNTLVTKKRLARYRGELAEHAARAGRAGPEPASGSEVIDGFDRLEEKIERQLAEAGAMQELTEESENGSVEEEFEKIRRRKDLEEELRRIRENMDE